MGRLRYSVGSLTAICLTLLAAATLAGQTAAAKKTPWGHPDLQGLWDFRTVTPLERPAEFANKATLTAAEAAEFEKRAVAARNADANRGTNARRTVNGTAETEDVALAYNDFWWDRGTKVVGTLRTSLVVDPPDGRIPALTPAGAKRMEHEDHVRSRPAWGPEDRGVGERCILGFNSGPPMVPNAYNMNVQILQTADHVVILNEMVHNARIVPLDNRPRHKIPQWVGESRARWDGDTLVVETSNFYENTSLRGSSAKMRLTERFKRTDADNLMYEFTVDDPLTWTKPWTAQIPMAKTAGPMYEYACHEGNYGMTGTLSGARAVEKRAEEPAKTSSSK